MTKKGVNNMKLKKIIFNKKILGVLNVLAVVLVTQTANSTCVWLYHQPEFPASANKFKKLK